jgi:hypothetical protein
MGLEGARGIVADSKAYSRRTLGLCLEHGIGLVTFVPRTCAVRQELEAWGHQHPVLPLLVEKPGRTKDEALRRWHGHSVHRRVEVEDSEGRIAQEVVRFVVVHSSQLALQHAQTYARAQEKEAEAAIAAYESRGQDHRGRRPRPWWYHTLRYGIGAASRRTRRGRPAKTDPPPTESGYRLAVEVEALPNAEEDNGWTVLATTVSAETCPDAELLQVYQE